MKSKIKLDKENDPLTTDIIFLNQHKLNLKEQM